MKATCIVVMLLCMGGAHAQDVMHLKDGSTIEFSKFLKYADPNETLLKTKAGQKSIADKDIFGYFDNGKGEFRYMKPKLDKDGDVHYTYVDQVLQGKVNVYSITTSTGMVSAGPGGYVNTSSTSYYATRSDTLPAQELSWGGLPHKNDREDIRAVRELMADAPAYQARLDTIKKDSKSVIALLREYNLAVYEKPSSGPYAAVLFYPDFKTDLGNMMMVVNDSLKIPMAIGKVAVFNIAMNSPSKVCFVSDKASDCELLTSWIYGSKNYQVNVSGNGEVEFKNARQWQVQVYLTEAKKKAAAAKPTN